MDFVEKSMVPGRNKRVVKTQLREQFVNFSSINISYMATPQYAEFFIFWRILKLRFADKLSLDPVPQVNLKISGFLQCSSWFFHVLAWAAQLDHAKSGKLLQTSSIFRSRKKNHLKRCQKKACRKPSRSRARARLMLVDDVFDFTPGAIVVILQHAARRRWRGVQTDDDDDDLRTQQNKMPPSLLIVKK